jgi:hypothetical protein
VRDLAQTRTLKVAALAASATALACYPRLALWLDRQYPVWYLEAVIFTGALVLWAFVFAWHTRHTGRPVCTLKFDKVSWMTATTAGILFALALHGFLDPAIRRVNPQDYPATLNEWVAVTLFILGFGQLFFVFAPFAFFIRLFRNPKLALVLTILFGVFVLLLKASSSTKPFPLLTVRVLVRAALGSLAVLIYLRGGLVPVWWLGALIEARHLPDLCDAAEPH